MQGKKEVLETMKESAKTSNALLPKSRFTQLWFGI